MRRHLCRRGVRFGQVSPRLRTSPSGCAVSTTGYAGPAAGARALVKAGAARLIDVRTAEGLRFVGRVPDSQHVAWQTGPR
ncbi:MAG TPA: hypothetical protein VER09_12915 [Pseudomonas sp.]|nr:hypothetical protein [Pseudomonas sp.]